MLSEAGSAVRFALTHVAAQITIVDGEVPVSVADEVQWDDAIRRAVIEAQVRGRLGAIIIEAPNKNPMMMVVGSSETALNFDSADGNPPYYASKGISNEDKHVMTGYLVFVTARRLSDEILLCIKPSIAISSSKIALYA
jgi:hypothetical protein